MPNIAGVITPNESYIFNEYGEEVLGCYVELEFYERCDFCSDIVNKLRCTEWRQSVVDDTLLCKNCVSAYL